MKRVKLEEIEILRGIAFLAVVLQHVISGVLYQPHISLISITIGTTFLALIRFAVPLFVFITGVVLFYNYDNQINYKSFLQKRFIQIAIPYFSWTIFYFVSSSFFTGIAPYSMWGIIIKIVKLTLTGTACFHLWFMVMIIPFYFLFLLFRIILSKKRKMSTNLIIVVMSFVFNIIIIYALNKGLIKTNNQHLGFIIKYLDRNFVFWIFYFILGGFVGLYYNYWKKFVQKLRVFSILTLLMCMCLIYSDITKINQNFNGQNFIMSVNVTAPLKPFMMLTIIVLIILVFSFSEKLVEKQSMLSNILRIFGKYSFGEYLIHAFILRFTDKFAISYMGVLGVYLQIAMSFVLCSLFSLALCLLINKMRISFSEILIGKV